jgi:hypothetical protein
MIDNQTSDDEKDHGADKGVDDKKNIDDEKGTDMHQVRG